MTNPQNKNPLFQHRHYATIASTIASLKLPNAEKEIVIYHFMDALRSTNRMFDMERFEAACRDNPINWRDRS